MKHSIFNYLDYRKALKEKIDARKKLHSKENYSFFADAIRVQSPYLSKVLNKQAHLNQDQLYLICEKLNFSEIEYQYMQLLLEFNRCGLKEREKKIKQDIKIFKAKHVKTENVMKTSNYELSESDLSEYYFDPLCLVIHMFLMIPHYQKNFKEIARVLYIKFERVLEVVDKLQRIGVIKEENGRWINQKKNLFITRNSPLFKQHQNLMKGLATHHQTNNLHNEGFNTMFTFTADKEAGEKIKNMLIQVLEEADKEIIKAPSEHVYQINTELFRWD